jgi:AraC-like DNA-binding protein
MKTEALEPAFFSDQVAGGVRFYREPAAAEGAGCVVVCGGCEQCSPDYLIRRRTFPYTGMEFVARGGGLVRIGGRDYPLVSGTVFLYGPGVAHEITTDRRAPLTKYFVDVTGKDASLLLRAVGMKPGQVFQTSSPRDIMTTFDELIRAGLRDTPFRPRLTALYLEVLLHRLAETRIPFGSAGTPAFETYDRCRHAIEERWREFTTLADVARACHVDGAYLCRLFRRFDHVSPYQYLLRVRMTHAAARLQQPGVSVKLVAAECSFSDPFHFSRVFKKVMGVSPSRYAGCERLQHRN